MPFRPVKLGDLSTAIAWLVEELSLRPAERLPCVGALAEIIGVSRPSLRESKAHPQGTGLLTTKRGAGVDVPVRPFSVPPHAFRVA